MADKNLLNLDLNMLLPLQSILRERNVTRAAAQLGISQPAMSSTLRRLRSALGDDLLIRSKGGYQLTPRGGALIAPVDLAIRIIERDILGRPRFDPATSIRRFKIAASSATIFSIARPFLTGIVATNPGLNFSFVDLGRTPDSMLNDPSLDLMLVPDVLPSEHPRERLYEEGWMLLVDKNNQLVGDQLSIADLQRAPRVIFESGGLRTHAELVLMSAGAPDAATVICDDFMTVLHLIPDSAFIGCVQTRVAVALAERIGLRIVQPPTKLPSFGIDLIVNPTKVRDPSVEWLAASLREVAARQPTQ